MINILGLSISERDIVIWNDRIKYIEKHKNDFESEEQFKKHIESLPQIVQNPDYIGIHPKGNSIQFIKRIEKNMLVGVRIKNSGNLVIRSSYPIDQEKLEVYLKSGTVRKFK